jgi:protein-L-isoaspartate(D-aspartate) O-methyltransferase
MVRRDLAGRGITDAAVLAAFAAVPRERFVPASHAAEAYRDRALPIGEGQTISQPYMVAFMAQALELRPGDQVLEVGAGSGYAAAILSRVAASVVAVERLGVLATRAETTLHDLGYTNVTIVVGDGSVGLAGREGFDAVCVSAGAPRVPPALVAQLRPGGRLVVPVGTTAAGSPQTLVRVRVDHNGVRSDEDLGAVHFVPLVGEQGWRPHG